MQEFFLPSDFYVIDTEVKQIKQYMQKVMDAANLFVFKMTLVFLETHVNEILQQFLTEKVEQMPPGLTGTLSWQP